MDPTKFHITLPSTTFLEEFPHNTSNLYKVRLPQPLRLTGSAWWVGLTDITLPDMNVSLPKLVPKATFVMYMTWFVQRNGKHKGKRGIVNLDDIQVMAVPDGEQFMKTLVDLLERKKLNTVKKRKPGHSLNSLTSQNLYMTIRWVPHGSDMDMLIDNSHTYIHGTMSTLEIQFDLPLALKMGWIKEIRTPMPLGPDDISYALGPNLVAEPHSCTWSDDPQVKQVLTNLPGEQVLWDTYLDQSVTLGARCNWRFINLNTAFRNLVGAPHRTLFVYSNVASGTIVGGQIVGLLREI